MLKLKILCQDLNGKKFLISPVVFESYIFDDFFRKSDKTWRRYREWSDYFIFDMFFSHDKDFPHILREVDEVCKELELDEQGRYVFYNLGLEFDKYYLKPDKFPLHCRTRLYRDYVLEKFFYPENFGVYRYEKAKWTIFLGDKPIFEFPKDYDKDPKGDWKIIHELSGQKVRRQIRVELSRSHGSLFGRFFNAVTPSDALFERYKEILPLQGDWFLPSDKGNFIIKGKGKYIISNSNVKRTGYYRIVKELDNVRFVELVEPFWIQPIFDDGTLGDKIYEEW